MDVTEGRMSDPGVCRALSPGEAVAGGHWTPMPYTRRKGPILRRQAGMCPQSRSTERVHSTGDSVQTTHWNELEILSRADLGSNSALLLLGWVLG